MKTRLNTSVVLAPLAAASLLASAAAPADILGINTPASSLVSITFDDQLSFNPSLNAGTTTTVSTSPWNGASFTLPLTVDPTTGDSAKANIDAGFIPSSPTYWVNLNSVFLNQLSVNTGQADLTVQFNIEYQLDALGLPAQPTLYPNFWVTGSVQPNLGSFAAIAGTIDYYGVNTAGTLSLLDTVTYAASWNTPGSFSGFVLGTPTNGTTPALVGNTTLTLVGNIRFTVDPASLQVQSIPEPSSLALAAVGLAALRRRCLVGKSGSRPGVDWFGSPEG